MKIQAISDLLYLSGFLPTLLIATMPPTLFNKARVPGISPKNSDLASLIKASEVSERPTQVGVQCTLETFTIGAFCSKYISLYGWF